MLVTLSCQLDSDRSGCTRHWRAYTPLARCGRERGLSEGTGTGWLASAVARRDRREGELRSASPTPLELVVPDISVSVHYISTHPHARAGLRRSCGGLSLCDIIADAYTSYGTRAWQGPQAFGPTRNEPLHALPCGTR